ncbi:MAG: two-component system response regulator FixJ [Gammaproteobacteria bacterium]|jgi:two-component system response regulator FixJ
MTTDTSTLFVVDDDRPVGDALALLAKASGIPAKTFTSADEFLSAYNDAPGCLVADVNMPGMSGLELQQVLLDRGYGLPVIILTGFGDVSGAVRAMKAGAVDFVEKPFDADTLIELVRAAIGRDRDNRQVVAERCRASAALQALTPREREVMELVVGGKSNKVIALDLGISERTVEIHRGRVMRKMGVRSLAHLVALSHTLKSQ